MVKTDAGEDLVAACPKCRYAANTETADLPPPARGGRGRSGRTGAVRHPGGRHHRRARAAPYAVPARRQLKTLVYMADERARAWRSCAATRSSTRRSCRPPPAQACCARRTPEEIPPLMGAARRLAGRGEVHEGAASSSIRSLAARKDMVTGANEDGFHLRGRGRGARPARARRARRAAHREGRRGLPALRRHARASSRRSRSGTSSSSAPGTRSRWGPPCSTPTAAETPMVMGSYGIGVERIMAAAIELHHDQTASSGRCRSRRSRPPCSPWARARARARRPRRSARRSATPASTCSTTTATSGPGEVQGRRPDRHPAAHRGREAGPRRGPGGVEAARLEGVELVPLAEVGAKAATLIG